MVEISGRAAMKVSVCDKADKYRRTRGLWGLMEIDREMYREGGV